MACTDGLEHYPLRRCDMQEADERFMRHALALAQRARDEGEVPVGAVVVVDGKIVGEGWNRPIATRDPTAHAEIQALRDAAANLGNYRLCKSTLYVTLEPCPMCAGAIVHARVERVVYAAPDPKGGAAGSVFDLLPTDDRFNHKVTVEGGLLLDRSSEILKGFFRQRRLQQKESNQRESQTLSSRPGPGASSGVMYGCVDVAGANRPVADGHLSAGEDPAGGGGGFRGRIEGGVPDRDSEPGADTGAAEPQVS